ncbi:J domain-containing protein [Prosthecomicrobium sp. N25]|uniref:J domain-containing protein n=1 Tax=Prosthecomicrobium sp. N25 TaxID=3129254 RepID=UPI0030784F6A
MKLDSKLFDRIRIKPEEDRTPKDGAPLCEWAGCVAAGTHPAPKGRSREGEYHRFCIDHVRLYNKSYNYFAGMKDDAIADYQKDAQTGHRPTWTMGANPQGWRREPGSGAWSPRYDDAFFLLRRQGRFRSAEAEAPPEPPRRKLKNLERKSLEVLDLGEEATGPEIKSRYKSLVKRHHPDANGGDRSSEGRLQEIIQAYNYLKGAGLC